MGHADDNRVSRLESLESGKAWLAAPAIVATVTVSRVPASHAVAESSLTS